MNKISKNIKSTNRIDLLKIDNHSSLRTSN
jgi:hypothetical protein